MEDLRSRSYAYGDDRMQMEPYGMRDTTFHPPSSGINDLSRCHSASYAYPKAPIEFKPKKGKGSSGSSSSSKSVWSLSDPELQRKKRVAGYKVYSVEGKVKGSFSKGFRWVKDRYTQAVYGWW